MGKLKGWLLCLILLCFSLTGCTADKFTKEEAEAQEKKAVEIFEQYLDEELGSGKIESVSVHKGTPLGPHSGYYLTDFVDGSFTYQGENYSFSVNTRTKEIYTGLELEEVKEKGVEYVLDFLGASCDEIIENKVFIELNVPAMGEDKENLYQGKETALSGVFPVGFEASKEGLESLFRDEKYEIKIYITYKGKEGLNPEGYGIGELPALKGLELKHMKSKARKSEELENIYDYMMSETLKETVGNESPTVRYAKWSHLEQDGFHIFFESYCRKDVDGVVRETTLKADEDIYLMVEGEKIEIFCAEETNFFLLTAGLSEKEAKEPVVWEFVRDSGQTGHTEVIWLWDGKRYVLGSKGERRPSSFQVRAGTSSFYLLDAAKKELEN